MKKKPEFFTVNTSFEQLTLEMFIEQAYQSTTTEPKKEIVEQDMADITESTDKV